MALRLANGDAFATGATREDVNWQSPLRLDGDALEA